MGDWSSNNSAHRTTWITLVHLNQLNKSFDDSKNVKIDELTFWGHADSEEMRTIILNGLSIQIDNYFTKLRGARYENGSCRDNALEGMQEILGNSSKTVEDLAQVCDVHYRFWKEGE